MAGGCANERLELRGLLTQTALVLRWELPVAREKLGFCGGDSASPEQADRAYYVVSEGEKATFFALEPFKGIKRGEIDRRHEMFVRALSELPSTLLGLF